MNLPSFARISMRHLNIHLANVSRILPFPPPNSRKVAISPHLFLEKEKERTIYFRFFFARLFSLFLRGSSVCVTLNPSAAKKGTKQQHLNPAISSSHFSAIWMSNAAGRNDKSHTHKPEYFPRKKLRKKRCLGGREPFLRGRKGAIKMP